MEEILQLVDKAYNLMISSIFFLSNFKLRVYTCMENLGILHVLYMWCCSLCIWFWFRFTFKDYDKRRPHPKLTKSGSCLYRLSQEFTMKERSYCYKNFYDTFGTMKGIHTKYWKRSKQKHAWPTWTNRKKQHFIKTIKETAPLWMLCAVPLTWPLNLVFILPNAVLTIMTKRK